MNKMEKYRIMDNIANGLTAVSRIQEIQKSTVRDDTDRKVHPGNLYLLKEVLQVLSDYAPEHQKERFDSALTKSSLYSNTYYNLKNHIQLMRGEKISLDHVAKTLGLVKPVVKSQHQLLIEKILKIYEIIQS